MKTDSEAVVGKTPRNATILGDDLYLVEMTERLQKLRSLMGEQQGRKGRAKRWAGRLNSSNSL